VSKAERAINACRTAARRIRLKFEAEHDTNRLKAIAFDLYGTLFDVHPVAARCDEQFAGRGQGVTVRFVSGVMILFAAVATA
jgi:hypothetical protein